MIQSPHGLSGDRELLSRSQVAELFNVSPSTVTRWADQGKLVCTKTLGGHRRYQRKSVVELVRTLTQEERMETLTLTIPKMYGDHHVSAVHRALAEIPGIADVWASAASKQLQITYDTEVIQPQEVEARLDEAGYSTVDGHSAPTVPSHHKDPAWAKMAVRMTQTHPSSA